MNRIRWRTRTVVLATVLAATACAPGERIDGSGTPGEFLECSRAQTRRETGRIPANAPLPLSTGPDDIRFPARAMPADTEVTFEALDPPRVGVRVTLSPPQQSFKPTTLVIRCQGPPPDGNWKIWRMPDEGEGGEPEPLTTRRVGNGFETTIERNSFFIIAN